MKDGQHCKLIYKNRKSDVISEIDKERKYNNSKKEKVNSGHPNLFLSGRQGLELRGYRNQGSLSLNIPEENFENFRALLCNAKTTVIKFWLIV